MRQDFFPILKKKLTERLQEGLNIGDQEVLEQIDQLLEESGRDNCLTVRDRERLRKELFFSVRRLDLLQELLEDPRITEIMVNGYNKIFVEKDG